MNRPASPSADGFLTERQRLRSRILTVGKADFASVALDVFRYQARYNPIYARYLFHLNVRPEAVTVLEQIPFMPIGFFRNHRILTHAHEVSAEESWNDIVFASSGTTGASTSRHVLRDRDLYEQVSQRIFQETYGPLSRFHILALLPSYLERNNSSLVYMVQRFIEKAGSSESGFFLHDTDRLTHTIRRLAAQSDRRILLIGVTFALLDYAESGTDVSFLRQLPDLIVMETGGMKGRRRELLREEVHAILTQRMGVSAIHSEYGMTELLSQAYSTGEGVFRPSPTLWVLLRDLNDPFTILRRSTGGRLHGGINVIDLANLDSCSFIETQDLGRYDDRQPGGFQVIGRFDNADLRGCNLMVG